MQHEEVWLDLAALVEEDLLQVGAVDHARVWQLEKDSRMEIAYILIDMLPTHELGLIHTSGVHRWPDAVFIRRPDTPPAIIWDNITGVSYSTVWHNSEIR